MREFGKDFKADVVINKFDLSEDLVMQPSLMQYYTELLASADTNVEHAKNKVKLVEGEKTLYYQANPVGGKSTDAATKASVDSDVDVNTARVAYVNALEEYNIYRAAVDTVRSKGESLKALSSLLIGGFYAGVTSNKKSDSDNM